VAVYGEEFAELEEVFGGSGLEENFRSAIGLFACSWGNLELLPLAEDQAAETSREPPVTVIFEKDGIPYINDYARSGGKGMNEKLDRKFAMLVESVCPGL